MGLKFRNKDACSKNKTAYLYPDSLISEQYRSIRTNIQFSYGKKDRQSILITSPNNREGKSVTAVNLALSLTQQKHRVLLVDANIKNPSLHTTFSLSNTSGLTDVLSNKILYDMAILKTEIGRLDVLPSGPSILNSAELIGSETMYDLIKETLTSYEYVIIDGPSVLEQSDTKILASLCDNVVLVVRSEKTAAEKAAEAKRFLELAKANIIGVVLNEKR
ncbi:CpsD/CapB family tyrosine-protein kinase [Mesobacillus harenae]|uniref:CpsD/CapB family tyrosine-protein kinase n=1 Tax=Mesobacillus harenae TaxID=2213203 RepID=UPI00158121CD|nr:CpsD/CapB family tyrosine-protein kinase [Mesobacillus harenae]